MRNERKMILNRARRVEDKFVLNLSFESFFQHGKWASMKTIKIISEFSMVKLTKVSLSLTALWMSFWFCISQIVTFIWSHDIFQSLYGRISSFFIINDDSSLDFWSALMKSPILLASSVIARSNSSLPLSWSLVPPPCLWFSKWSPSNTIATPSPRMAYFYQFIKNQI